MFSDQPKFDEISKEKLKENLDNFLSIEVFSINKDEKELYPMHEGDIAEFAMTALNLQPAANKEVVFRNKEVFQKWLTRLKLLSEQVEVLGEKELPEYSAYAAYVISGTTKNNLESIKKLLFNRESENYDKEYGKLMGFPDTAIEAYLGEREQVPVNTKTVEDGFGHFVYSKEFEDEERKYFNDRNKKLKEFAPSLFKK